MTAPVSPCQHHYLIPSEACRCPAAAYVHFHGCCKLCAAERTFRCLHGIDADAEGIDDAPWQSKRAPSPVSLGKRARLTLADVLAIKGAAGQRSQHALAREYHVSATAIGDILCGRTWAHVPAPAYQSGSQTGAGPDTRGPGKPEASRPVIT